MVRLRRVERLARIAPHNARSKAKHETFPGMSSLALTECKPVMAQELRTLRSTMPMASARWRRSGAFLRRSGRDGIAARLIVRLGGILQVLDGLLVTGRYCRGRCTSAMRV